MLCCCNVSRVSTDKQGDPGKPLSEPELAERHFAHNLRAAREAAGLSQAAVAERMQDLGYSWHQQTVVRTENATRPLRLGEAVALMHALAGGPDKAYGVDALTRRPELATEAWYLLKTMRDCRAAIRAAADASMLLENAASHLKSVIAMTEKRGHAAELADELALARRALADASGEPAPAADVAEPRPLRHRKAAG